MKKIPANFPFDSMYEPYHSELLAFGKHWCGPEQYEFSKDELVARYEAEGDGQPVEVYCCAMPARFYKIKALPGKNSIGEFIPPWEAGTGSSMAELAASLAKAVSEGMFNLKPRTDHRTKNE